MRRLAQSTAYTVMVKLFLSSDHVTAATGKTVAITISKAGGAFGNPNAGASNGTEVSNGWYKFALDTTDTGSLGDLVVRGAATSCDDAEQVCQVISATTGGATNLDAAVSAVKTKTDSLTFTVANQVDVNVLDWKSATAPAMTGDAFALIGTAGAGLTALGDTRIAHLDADVSTRATPTNITAGTITTVTNLTNAPTAGDLTAAMKASVTTAATAATPTIGAVASVTGNVGGNVVGSVGSVAGAVASVTGNVGGNVVGSVGSVAAAVTVTGTVNADIKKVNGVTVNGNGAGTPWGP